MNFYDLVNKCIYLQYYIGDVPSISTEYKEAFSSRPRLSRTAEGSRTMSVASQNTFVQHSKHTHYHLSFILLESYLLYIH